MSDVTPAAAEPERSEPHAEVPAAPVEAPAPVPQPVPQEARSVPELMTRAAPQEPAFKPEQILAHERSRISGIYEAARKLHVDQALADDLVKRGTSLAEARGFLIDAAAAKDAAIETRPSTARQVLRSPKAPGSM